MTAPDWSADIEAHVAPVLARLRLDPVLATCTFEGDDDIPTGLERYAVVYPDNGFRLPVSLRGYDARATFTFTIHTVGATREQAQDIGGRVFAQMLGFAPVIPGRASFPMRHASSQPIQTDKDSDPWVRYGVDQFDLTTVPARRGPTP